MKKRPCLLDSDWKNFNKNASDFLEKSIPNKRKRLLQKPSCTLFSNDDKIVQYSDSDHTDENITWQSSFDENVEFSHIENKDITSPVFGKTQRENSGGFCIKSTPAGSPILSQKQKPFKSVKSVQKKLSLFPLSPITPGTSLNFSFQNTSQFSFHVYDESNNNDPSHDQTPLALPLPDSDNEIVEDYDPSMPSSTFQSDDIEIFSTQDDDTTKSPQSSTLKDVSLNLIESESAGVKGSEWIESMMEKLDRTCQSSFNPSAIQASVSYDSTKKQKLLRGGLAERLQGVVKKEQTSKIFFKHQAKESKRQNLKPSQTCIKFKVVSHHKEGLLHILECKVLFTSDVTNKNTFYTVILNDENVINDGLDLMSVFTLYPPWKEIRLDRHDFPVLICAYHLIVESDSTLSAAASQSQLDSQDEACLAAVESCVWTRDCESLLEALEKQDHDAGICLAATVQRQYQQATPSGVRWAWLCEDAFGVFFELLLETSLSDDVTWSSLITHGEGQRLYFRKIFLTGRTSRSQSPLLFTLIDSVWDPEGFGLQQIQNSQSQSNSESDSCPLVPPGFCYRFLARRWQSACHCHSNRVQDDVVTLCSELNRPRIDGSTPADVLYRPCAPLLCADASSFVEGCTSSSRCSILGSVYHVHLSDHPPLHDVGPPNPSRDAINIVFVMDHSSSSHHLIPVIFAPHHGAGDLTPGDGIFVKDMLLQPDLGFRTDSFSYVCVLDEKACDKQTANMLPPHVLSKEQISCHCIKSNLPPHPVLNAAVDPGRFASVSGIICDLTLLQPPDQSDSSRDQSASSRERSADENFESILRRNCLSSESRYSFELLIMISFNIKVKLKCRLETILAHLPKDSAKISKGKSSLNGMKFKSVDCYVYAKYVKTHLTLFYAEEVFNR